MPELAEVKKAEGGDGATLAAMLEMKAEKFAYQILEEEKIAGSRVRYKLHLTEEAITPRLEMTFKEFNKAVRLPGFRPGKAPAKLLRARYEESAREETVKRITPRLAELVVEEKKIDPLSEPYMLSFKCTAAAGTTIEFALEIRPEIAVTDETLNDLKIDVYKVSVDDMFVDARIEDLRARSADFAPGEGAYEAKDALVLTCTVSRPGGAVIVDRSVVSHYTTNVEGEMPEEVSAALLGKKAGDSLSLDIVEDVEGGAPGEKENVHYEVKVEEVKKRVLPALDDEFAKDVSEKYNSVSEMKDGVRAGLLEEEENRQREETLTSLLAILSERLTFDLPRALVDQASNQAFGRMEKQLNQYGMTLRNLDRTLIDNYAAGVQVQSRQTVKNALIIGQLTKFFAINVDESVISAGLERLSKGTNRKPLALRAQLEAKKQWGQFLSELDTRATTDALITKAVINLKEISHGDYKAVVAAAQQAQALKLQGDQ